MRERLCIITRGGDVLAEVRRALSGIPPQAALLQLREKALSGRALYDLAVALVATGARVLVNDRADVALAAGAAGVHLPEDGISIADARALLGPGMLIGASAHSVEGALKKAAAGADLVTLAPIWDSPGKGPALGVEALALAARALPERTALFALGGVDAARTATALRAGAHGVAAIRAVLASHDPGRAAAELLAVLTAG